MNQNELYHVIFYGDIAEGTSPDVVKKNLIRMFRLSPERIQSIFAGQPLVVKESVDYQTALKYQAAFEQAGTQCRLVPVSRNQPGREKTAPQSPPVAKKSQDQRYHVVFRGELVPGASPDQVKAAFAKLFRADSARIAPFFSGQPVRIKSGVPAEQAKQYQRALRQAGAICHLEAIQSIPVPPSSPAEPDRHPPQQAAPGESSPLAPKLRANLAPFRSNFSPRDGVFLAPNIPEGQLDLAIKAYAYAFGKQGEHAVLLAQFPASAGGLLLSDQKLYLYKRKTPPRTIKLPQINSVSAQENILFINQQKVFLMPASLRQHIPVLVKLIQTVAAYAAQHAPRDAHPPVKQTEHVHKERKKEPASLKKLIVAALSLLLLGGGVYAHQHWFRSPTPEEPSREHAAHVRQEEPHKNKGQQAATFSESSTLSGGIQDKGSRCQKHEYILPGGSFETVVFSQKYPFENKETIEYRLADDPVAQYGVQVGFPMAISYETVTQSYKVWALDGRRLFDEIRQHPDYDATLEMTPGGVPYCLPLKIVWGDLEIHWRDDGYGILAKFNRLIGKKDVGTLTEEAIRLKLDPAGIESFVIFQWHGIVYDLKPEMEERKLIHIEETDSTKIQSYEISVSTPDTIPGEEQHTTETLRFMPFSGENQPILLDVRWYTTQERETYFTLSGPALTAECLKDTE